MTGCKNSMAHDIITSTHGHVLASERPLHSITKKVFIFLMGPLRTPLHRRGFYRIVNESHVWQKKTGGALL